MYLFGIDIPIVELFFVFLLLGIAIAIFLVFEIFKVIQMNKRMYGLLDKEKSNMQSFSDITEEEKKELKELKSMEKELDKLLKEEESDLKLLQKIREARKRHTEKKTDKGREFIKALLGATMQKKTEPVWATEKWKEKGLVLTRRDPTGKVVEVKRHPLEGVPEHKLPWKKEHWKEQGDVKVLRRDDGMLIDWEKF